jgi:hypothetical protein
MFEEWNCEVCGKKRLGEDISIAMHDFSATYSLPYGTVVRNVKYCNDNPTCKIIAKGRERWQLKQD